MTAYKTRYACTSCYAEKFLPERPLTPSRTIRTGCDRCGAIMPHHPVGHPAGTGVARGWGRSP